MKVCTYELAALDEGGFQKSKQAEKGVLSLIGRTRKKQYWVDESPGKNTDWDGKLGEDYVEIKFSAKTFSNTPYYLGNFFETHYKSGEPSALLLTKATKYITITPGWSNKYNSLTGKVRMWEVSDLLHASETFPIVEYDYGEYGFYIPNKCDNVKHVWLGDVEFDQQKCIYDVSKWI